MSFNLVRNSRVLFTTNLTSSTINSTGFTTANTVEVQVLEGFSFTQTTNSEDVTLNEAGANPNRGKRTFNTSLAPVDFSFTTYIRPRLNTGQATAEERVLWNALLCADAQNAAAGITGITTMTRANTLTNVATLAGTIANGGSYVVGDVCNLNGTITAPTTAGVTKEWLGPFKITAINVGTNVIGEFLTAPGTGFATTATITSGSLTKAGWVEVGSITNNASLAYTGTGLSNKNQLQAFGLIIIVDATAFLLDNCALNQASIDFAIDQIAQVAWSGNGSAIRQITAPTLTNTATAATTLAGSLTGTYTTKVTTANYITNKLSTATLIKNIAGVGTGNTTYNVAITGGNITINNNISYVTPANLGTVNTPITYFTSTRNISGNLTAYLRVGSTNTAGLLSDLLTASATSAENPFRLQVEVGGASNANRVEFEMKGASLQIPTTETQQVVSTTINFSGQSFNGVYTDGTANTGVFDLTNTNDLMIRYYAS